MNRREFIERSFAVGAGAALLGSGAMGHAEAGPVRAFGLKYAPHLGMFKHLAGNDPIDQLEFIAAQGFTAFEDNRMKNRPVEQQESMANAMASLGLEMGVFVATADFQNATFASSDGAVRARVLNDIRASVEVAKRVNARWCTVVLGRDDAGVDRDYQTANAINLLKRCAEICEPAGLTMVMEPLNPWRNHPGMFVTRVSQAHRLCEAVDSPACKILFDVYHQQMTEGSIMSSIDQAWDEIAYFQTGDNPGRKEPTTGEINYRNIFAHLKSKRYRGIIGMEHGNSRPGATGEKAVIDAYMKCDNA